jgi:TonB family protein
MMTIRKMLGSLRGRHIAIAVSVIFALACQRSDAKSSATGSVADIRPDVLPVMLNKDLPFRYPPALYAEKTQGNVTLRLYIDTSGMVVNDSTHVAESSQVAALDSAAVKGARELRFVPAKLDGKAIAVSILFPVYFRHPEVAAPPGDSVLKHGGDTMKPQDTPKSVPKSVPTLGKHQ